MDSLETTREQIERLGIVAAIRCRAPVDVLLELGDALHAVPLTAVFIGAGSVQPWAAISEFRRRYGAGMVVGAGLLGSMAQIDAAIDAGAHFVVSGTCDLDAGVRCRNSRVLYLPGVQNTAEAARAIDSGWSLVNFFPAGSLGADRLTQITAGCPDAHVMVAGGIHAGNLRGYAGAGARAAVVRGVVGPAMRWRMSEVIMHMRKLRTQWEEACRLR